MKKIVCSILILLMTVASAGCSKKNAPIAEISDTIDEDGASSFQMPNESFADPETLPDASSETATEANKDISGLDGTKQAWGVGIDFDEYNRPVSNISFQEKYGKYDADFIKENTNKIYLTFDEGYEAGYTATILDILKEKQVSAVFFVTYGYASEKQDLVQRMIDEGHIVANHSYSHPSMPELNEQKCTEEIVKLDTFIQEKFNYKMTLFRPPMGEFSEKTLAITKNLNYRSVFWSFAYKDWLVDDQPAESDALNNMVERLHNGAIYLLHAVSKTNTNVLESFIDQAIEKGYVFSKYI